MFSTVFFFILLYAGQINDNYFKKNNDNLYLKKISRNQSILCHYNYDNSHLNINPTHVFLS